MKASIGTCIVRFANETQNKVHYAMPVRTMLYDALEYTKQIQDFEKQHKEEGISLEGAEFLSGLTKEDRLEPVITTVLYLGENWKGAMSLYDLLKIDLEDPVYDGLKEYIPDYRINISEEIPPLQMRRALSGGQQYSFRSGYNLLLKCEPPADCRGAQKKYVMQA